MQQGGSRVIGGGLVSALAATAWADIDTTRLIDGTRVGRGLKGTALLGEHGER